MPNYWIRFINSKYNLLLSVLILCFLIYPFGYENIAWEALLFTLFTGIIVTIVFAIYQLQPNKRIYRIYIGLAGLVFCLEILRLWITSSSPVYATYALIVIHHLVLIFLMVSSAFIIVREIFSIKQVSSDTIKGGVCVYLLAGIAWSYLYNLLYTIQPQAFNLNLTSNVHDEFLYFSFLTLTTVGYGDILPVSPLARVCANLEAVIGVLYPSIYIARLVGQYSNEQKPE